MNKTTQRRERTERFIKQVRQSRDESSSFAKVLIGMIIVFLGILLSIFVLADNENFLAKQFGEDSPITKIFQKLAASNRHKEHADFTLPFGLRRQNILFLGVDASGNPDDLWTGTRTDTIILINIDPKPNLLTLFQFLVTVRFIYQKIMELIKLMQPMQSAVLK